MEEKIQDRFNPFTGLINPLKNPIAPVGVSPSDAKALRNLHKTALNIPLSEGFATNEITVPITTSEDMLGLAKMCKEKATNMANPFTDPDFSAHCGICMTEGTYYDGTSFKGIGGLLAYDKRKDEAIAEQESKGYAFPRATPFAIQNKNTCVGANSEPVFAITGDWYNKIKKRDDCIHGKTLGEKGCAVCYTTKQYTWLDPVQTPNRSSFLLFGRGIATVSVDGKVKAQNIPLNMNTPSEVVLGAVKEGSSLQVLVTNVDPNDTEAAYVYIALKGENASSNDISFFDAYPFFSSDLGNTVDKSILRLGKRQFPGVKVSLMGAKASKDVTVNKIHMDGVLPLTFIDSANTIGAFDCPNSPLMTLESSAEKLLDDPCLKRNQTPGNYSDACLRSLAIEGTGCTALGDLVKKPNFRYKGKQTTLRDVAGNKTKAEFVSFVQKDIAGQAELDPENSLLCTGKDISTPCDTELKNPNADPTSMSQECLTYLYKNGGNKERIGLPYGTESSPYMSADITGKTMFCQRSGQMNPETTTGLSIFRQKIQELSRGLRGVDAVKETLKTVFMRATSDLPIEKEDNDGGRATSYRLCFDKGFTKSPSNADSRTLQGTLPASSTQAQTCNTRILSDTFTPRQGNSLLNNKYPIWISKNFTLTFLLKPTGLNPNWTNILRFGRTVDGNTQNIPEDCCMHGVRALGIWFFPNSTRLHVRISHERNGNWGIDTSNLDMNKTYQCFIQAKDSLVTVRVTDTQGNNPSFESTENTTNQGQRYEGWVSVWGSDPWYTPARAVVSDLCFQT